MLCRYLLLQLCCKIEAGILNSVMNCNYFSMQAHEEAKKRLQVAEKSKQELVSDLRTKSRIEYLEKRQADRLVALRDDLADEQDLYSDVR